MTLSTILLLDLETSGLDPAKDCPVEAAWAVYSLEHRAVMRAHSTLVDATTYRGDAVDAVRDLSDLHKITPEMWRTGLHWDAVEKAVKASAGNVDAIVAHNASFDRRWFRDETIQAKPWICTLNGVRWPEAGKSKRLGDIALEHGVAVIDAHRALPDVQTLARLLTMAARLGHDVSAILERGLRPTSVYVVADTDFDPARNALAKEHGFSWVGERKVWERTMADEDAAGLPFRVRRVAA